MIIPTVLILAALMYSGVRELKRKKWWWDLTAYIIIFLIGSAMLILRAAGVKTPYIVDEISKFFKNTLHIGYY